MRDDLEAVAKRMNHNGDLYLFLVTLDESERQAAYGELAKFVTFKPKSFPYVMKKGAQVYGS